MIHQASQTGIDQWTMGEVMGFVKTRKTVMVEDFTQTGKELLSPEEKEELHKDECRWWRVREKARNSELLPSERVRSKVN